MPNATPQGQKFVLHPPKTTPPKERQVRLRDRDAWLRKVDLLAGLNALLDYLPQYRFFLKRRAGELMFVSRNMLHTLRATDEASLIGVHDYELTPGPLAEIYRSRDETVLQTGQPLLGVIEVWFTYEGLPQWFTCYKLPLRDRQGRIVGIIGFLEEYKHPPSLPVSEPLKSLVDYIEEHLSQPITVRQLAEHAYLSERQVQRLFCNVFGLSPKKFITKARIHKAASLIAETELSLSQIALEVGLSDQSSLTFYFRRELGMTPNKFRHAAHFWRNNPHFNNGADE